MDFEKNDRVQCSFREYNNKTGSIKKIDTLQLEKSSACIVKFDDIENLVMIYTKYLTKI